MDETGRAFLAEHERRFNDAVSSGDFAPLVELFADDAELEFVGVPVGPFVGRDAIAAAYETQPPDDALDVQSVDMEARRNLRRALRVAPRWDRDDARDPHERHDRATVVVFD